MSRTASAPYFPAAFLCLVLFAAVTAPALAQSPDRVQHNGHDLFLSGSNVAWINFASDIGPGTTNLELFDEMFRDLRASGGNAMRLWLHTTGGSTPQWDGHMVVGPGVGAVDDLRAILDLAEANDVGLLLCLWSFDMLRISNGTTLTDRAHAILTQAANRKSYIDNSLIPMVDALKGHPAIIAWEIFNEAEGMSNEFGWAETRHVPMIAIQQFVNLTAGAIKRTDPDAQVTTGVWGFKALSDVLVAGSNPTTDRNYYRDDRLVGLGGDPLGTLDFYTVHYYDWAGTVHSPFHNDASKWELGKPLVIAEFYIKGNVFGVNKDQLYATLRSRGYAGGLSWQWVDWAQRREDNTVTWPNTLINTRAMWENFPEDVDLSYGGLKATLTASDPVIAEGGSVRLRWNVRGAVDLSLNGEPVFFVDSLDVSPATTTTYVLTATDRDGELLERQVHVQVVAPDELNRARSRPAFASGGSPQAAVDGDPETVWETAGGQGHWLYVDLGSSFDVSRLALSWAQAPTSVGIDHSFDAVIWDETDVIDGELPSEQQIAFETPVYTRFLRIRFDGPARLAELQAFGLPSATQRFRLDLISPAEGDTIEGEAYLQIDASLFRRPGPPSSVRFYIDDELIGTDATAPYSVSHYLGTPGQKTLSAQVTDGSYTIHARPVAITVLPSVQKTRYEAETATLTGPLAVRDHDEASGSQYVMMEAEGTIAWNVNVLTGGDYVLRFGYNLPFDYKAQFLTVNGSEAVLPFNPPTQTWAFRDTSVTLVAGQNTVSLRASWGYMWFDYLEVRGNGQYATSDVGESVDQAHGFRLFPNYPNPFNPQTVIAYEMPASGSVRLKVFDVTGRLVATLADGFQSAGRHEISFDASRLSSGVYLYRLEADGVLLSGKMLLLK